ncbi:MAG: protein phosphatase 2C domain-containing protein [Chloroflexaceae bacterium]|jgi:serine/threonine protein phosphatase PrpC|nr:protein phosphatase 2C domain-containing protein [Chloroflexaceae bacterium]
MTDQTSAPPAEKDTTATPAAHKGGDTTSGDWRQVEAARAEAQASADAAAPESDSPENDAERAPTMPLESDDTRALPAAAVPEPAPARYRQGLSADGLRDIGRVRKINQDSIYWLLTSLPRENLNLPMGLFVVADGMGGHDGGEIASRLAIRTVAHHILAELVLPALDDAMGGALQSLMVASVEEANQAIWQQAQRTGSHMGTTCTAALLLGHSLYIAHVGDSRAYLLEDGQLRPLTDDHSAVGRLIQLGQLEPSEAREHPLRNQLYRTVGQQPDIPVDFIYQPAGKASHLLLCSDGLWGMLQEDEMAQVLLNNPVPLAACHELIARANAAGGDDNISAVVVALPVVERNS